MKKISPGTRRLVRSAKSAAARARKTPQQPAAPGTLSTDMLVTMETIRILNGWRLTRPAEGPRTHWMLWHASQPQSLGQLYYQRVIEIDAHGIWGENTEGVVSYTTLHCAQHERVVADAGSEPGSHVLGSRPHCKWCGELWERIEERAKRLHGQSS